MAHSTSATAIATLVKSFTYRDNREEWSNAYHLDQVPPDSGSWNALLGAIWGLEQVFLAADVQIETGLGHTPGTPPVLVYEYDWPPAGQGGQAGTFVPAASQHPAPGDAAMTMRYGTTQKTILGKPIYLRNYWHGVYTEADKDYVTTQQVALMDALGRELVNGIVVNGVTYRRAGPRGAVAQNHLASPYVTTRTLKKRGKRKRNLPAGSTVQLPPLVIN